MTHPAADPVLRARKITSTVIKSMHDGTSQAAVAAAMGMSESTVSRFISDHLDKFALVLAHVGLKVVPAEACFYDPEYVQALRVLAGRAMRAETPKQMEWDE